MFRLLLRLELLMTDAPDLDHLEALLADSWSVGVPWETYPDRSGRIGLTHIRIPGTIHPTAWPSEAELIVGAINALPALIAALREAEAKLAAIQGHFDHVYAEDDEGEYGNIPDIYDPDFYRGLDFGLRPIRAILDIAEGS